MANADAVPRIERRFAKRMIVRLSYPEADQSEIARTVNVSLHGVQVVCRRFWHTNLRLSVESINRDFYSRARVAYCQPLTNGSYSVGLELFVPSDEWTDLAGPLADG